MSHKEFVIVGGGPVGLSMAISLARAGKKVTLIDHGLDKVNDGRVLALSFSSQKFLTEIGAWPQNPTAINEVQISHSGLGISRIKAGDLNLSNLGFTVSYTELCAKLLSVAKNMPLIELIIGVVTKVESNNAYSCVEYLQDEHAKLITCELLIMAEGGKLLNKLAKIKNHDYTQQAIVAHIKTKLFHNSVAHERFGVLGPLVLLPYQDHYVVVWSLADTQAADFIASPDLFISTLDDVFSKRFGGAKLLGGLYKFPLKLHQIKSRVNQRMVIIGNSAQLVHPVSAQGLNLGLRDVRSLRDIIVKDGDNFSGLLAWDKSRQHDVDAVVAFTHFLATKMEPQSKLLQHLRGAGIIALSNLPLIQNKVAQSLIFGVLK